MRLISWNVNGLRACLNKGFAETFAALNADVFCVQETKMQPGQADFAPAGYAEYLSSAEKKGYSGTACWTRVAPLSVRYGIGPEVHSHEGRAITLEFAEFFLVNVYTPNSQEGLARIDYRMQWEDDLRAYLLELDADKEGFLRSETSLIQTIGRAARNADGMVILYADTVTPSMRRAMDETERRREKQDAYNKAHGITPRTVVKSVRDLLEISAAAEDAASAERQGRVKAMTKQQKAAEIARLEKAMKEAAKMLEFELAAALRDQIIELRGK